MNSLFRVVPKTQSDWSPNFDLAQQKKPSFLFVEPFRITGVFQITVLLCNSGELELQIFSFRICWLRAEFMFLSITASCSGSEAANQPQNITITPPCLTAGMIFYTSYIRTQTSISSVHGIFFKSLLANVIWTLALFLEISGFFALALSHGCHIWAASVLLLTHEHWP